MNTKVVNQSGIANYGQKLELFVLYYNGKATVKDGVVVCAAKNSKDMKAKMAKAMTVSASLNLMLKTVASDDNKSFTVKPLFS